MAHYFLISSLPMLKYNGEMPITYSQFLQMAKDQVSKTHYEILEKLTLTSSKGVLIDRWSKFYKQLQGELSYQRKLRLGKKVQPLSDRDDKIVNIVTTAMSIENALEAEELLLSIQFEKIDELIGMHIFDDCALNGYAIKLKLLERKSLFTKEKGKVEFSRIIASIEDDITSMEN